MSSENVLELIKFLIVVGGLVATAFKGFDYLEKKAKENSVGAEKVKELEEEDAAIRKEFKELEKNEERQDDKIEQLEKHYDSLINKVWDFFKK